jgi:hypothetical protein
MSYYITTSTAELAYYNNFTDEAKDEFHYQMSGKRYVDLPQELKDIYTKLSSNAKKYIDAEDKEEQNNLWESYDKFSQFLCDIDKYIQVYKTDKYY